MKIPVIREKTNIACIASCGLLWPDIMGLPFEVSNGTICFPHVIYFSKNIMMIGIRLGAGQYRNHWPARTQSAKKIYIKGEGDNHHGDQGHHQSLIFGAGPRLVTEKLFDPLHD